jgi:ketosteroid isomerase-like protein
MRSVDGDIQVIEAAYAAWFRGDEAGMMALVHPEIVVTQIPEQVDVRPYHGHDGLREVMADWVGSWEGYSIEMLGTREVGHGVVTALHQSGRGKGSGIPMEADTWFAWHLKDGKLIRWEMFSTEHQALEAAERAYP